MSFPEADLTRDAFLGGRLHLYQPRTGYRAAIDPVLLAASCPARPGDRILDLGCGVGTAGLCLARRVADLDLHGLEIQPDYAELAARNAAENDLGMRVHTGDLRRPPPTLKSQSFDAVLLNPPFFGANAATPSPDPGRDVANREGAASLAEWLDFALKRLHPGGRVLAIHRTERLADLLVGLDGRAGAIEVLPIASRAGLPAARVLIRARKGRSQHLKLFPPLTAHEGRSHASGGAGYTNAVNKVLRDMHELLFDARIGGIGS